MRLIQEESKMPDAVILNLLIIGEVVKNVSHDMRNKYPP